MSDAPHGPTARFRKNGGFETKRLGEAATGTIWQLYAHRQDESVVYLARPTGAESYEVKHPGASDGEAFVLDSRTFEAIYERSEE